ncbi:MAG: MoaD/ThiS family protein [Solirubrobacterales bacterium]|nr:MoaD/ThiS family protein [Solirubrobacterales bacterium]
MSVNVKIPTQLRDMTAGAAEVAVDGATVGDCLESLFTDHPALKDRLTDENGLRRFVNLYVAGEDIRFLDGLQTPIADGAELTVLPAVAGG